MIIAASNRWAGAEQRCKALWQDIPHGTEPGSAADARADEVECLMPVARPFDGVVGYGKRVSPTCLVHLERNRYSVPTSFANRPVSLGFAPSRPLPGCRRGTDAYRAMADAAAGNHEGWDV
ncbi:transposase [Sphingobium sp. MI1205]|nr:transposase [Sphingobium sp. MI1205]